MLVNESQIRALIRLLADEDEKIVQTISGKLIDIGPSAVPLLQEAEIEQPEKEVETWCRKSFLRRVSLPSSLSEASWLSGMPDLLP